MGVARQNLGECSYEVVLFKNVKRFHMRRLFVTLTVSVHGYFLKDGWEVHALPCGAYSSQKGWVFDADACVISWNELCLTIHPEASWKAYLQPCTHSSMWQFFVAEGRLFHIAGSSDSHARHCLAVLNVTGPSVGMRLCHRDNFATQAGLDWALQALH